MAIAHLLEDFTSRRPQDAEQHVLTEGELEDIRLSAFETGYGAGWDDALKSQTGRSTEISESLVQAINEMSFSFHEARQQMTRDLAPVFDELFNAVFPEMLRATLGLQIREHVIKYATSGDSMPARICVHPNQVDPLNAAVSGTLQNAAKIIGDPNLDEAEAYLSLGTREIHINCPDLLTQIRTGLEAVFRSMKDTADHG